MIPSDELPASSLNERDQQALQWFVRLRDTPVSSSSQQAFENWCAEHSDNQPSYQKIATLWESKPFSQAVFQDKQRLPPIRLQRKRSYIPELAIAASLLLVTTITFYSGLIQRLNADSYTSVGEQREFVFADGSRALLDTDTAIAVDYTPTTRSVKLLSGRAFFTVSHNTQQPFIVQTDKDTVRVVGTRFSVQTRSNKPLEVQQGIVSYNNKRGDTLTVTAGKYVSTATDKPSLETIDSTQEAFNWTHGRLIFSNQRLADVLAEVDRYQPGIIMIKNSALAEMRVTGNYKLNTPMQIVDSLAQVAGGTVSKLSPYLTIIN